MGQKINPIRVQKLSIQQAENRLLVIVIVTRKKYLIMNIGKETVYRWVTDSEKKYYIAKSVGSHLRR